MTSVKQLADGLYWRDPLVAELMSKHECGFFAEENTWEDWPPVARKLGAEEELWRDLRNVVQKRIHRYLFSRASLEQRCSLQLVKKVLQGIGYRKLRSRGQA